MNNINFKKHNIEWTNEKISRFWDYCASNKDLFEDSVAKQNGEGIVKFVKKYIKKDGRNLDYGSGPGYLLDYLFQNNISCFALDSSPDSLENIKEKFKNNPLLKDVILSTSIPNKDIKTENFDFVFFIETIEHVSPEFLKNTLEEMNRIVKPGGYILITTPNKENLEKKKVICPECGCIFHRVQHMNSFSVEKLSNLMSSHGFERVFCKETIFTTGGIFNKVKYIINNFMEQINFKKKFKPNLIYLGRKK